MLTETAWRASERWWWNLGDQDKSVEEGNPGGESCINKSKFSIGWLVLGKGPAFYRQITSLFFHC